MSKNQVYLIVGGGCLVALCAVTAMLIGTLLIAPRITSQLNPVAKVTTVAPVTDLNVNDNSLGDPNALIHITEFGDFQCPYCKRFHNETEPSLISTYVKTSKVYFTYRSAGNWVSGNAGGDNTESQDAALAAYCAGDQGKFWQMHDALFANNHDVENQGSFTAERLTAIAQSINLDTTAYQACYDNGKYKDRVQKDYDDAMAANIQGTPFFVIVYKINGTTKTKTIDGAQPFGAFQQAINDILNQLGLSS